MKKKKLKVKNNSFDIKILNLKWYIASVILKILIVNFAMSAFIIGCFFDDNQYHQLMFFTEQSNFLALIVTIISLFLVVSEGTNGVKKFTPALEKARFTVAILVSITCLIFMCILMPVGLIENDPGAGNFKWDEIILHAVVPPLVVIDVLIFNNNFVITKKDILISIGFMTFYLGFIIFAFYTNLSFNPNYPELHNYPYFFMNFNSHTGWFGIDFHFEGNVSHDKNAIGSFYWILFLLALVLSLGFAWRHIMNRQTVKHLKIIRRMNKNIQH